MLCYNYRIGGLKMDMIKINYSKQALKFLKRQDKDTATRIIKAVRKIPTKEISISRLHGHPDLLKIRVGDFRVVFNKDYTEIVVVSRIGNRGDIYNNY